ncbi:CGNR zinc finger domain-containing protein [Patulibacter sp.]|uniref:CGNR zinc finger domain-containing protein n=1 Tax=Patulibacter sp. TaxID=1912859 RepID=UPI0027267E41|nr:CGNR zinc finger domain-containing protein [Patulibacter sp.]MDO9410814.1 CGNR zinc finger domain-containing protein [Patulibacter sp.]
MQDPRPLSDEPLPIDLVNTELWAEGERVDLIADTRGLQTWLAAIGRPECPVTPAALARLHDARSAIRAVLEDDGDAAARRRLNAVLDRGRRREALGEDGPTSVVEVRLEEDRLPWEAAGALLRLLRTDRDRLRPCGGHGCVLWFHDASRSGRRQWCSMATCGNRAKARRHHARGRDRTETEDLAAGPEDPPTGSGRAGSG